MHRVASFGSPAIHFWKTGALPSSNQYVGEFTVAFTLLSPNQKLEETLRLHVQEINVFQSAAE
jgi:hypothetical protein